MKQQIFDILSTIAIIACFVPFLIVIIKKLWHSLPFLLFACYWAVGGMVNMVDKIPNLDKSMLEKITVIYNMLDVPIVLAMIHFISGSRSIRRFTSIVTPLYLGIELVNYIILGIHYDAAKYMLAVGLILVLYCLGWEIANYVQKLEHTDHEKAIVFLHASLLFVYGTFIIIYIFDYFVSSGSGIDNFLVYYVSCLVGILIATVGYLSKGAKSRRFV